MLTHATSFNPKGDISNQQVIMHILAKMKKEIPMHTDQTEDYGPQRFCNECGCRLLDVYEEMDSNPIWMHPESECSIIGVVESDNMNSGVANHTEMSMDDLRESYKKVLHTDWYKENKKVLYDMYHYVCANGEDPESGDKVYTKAVFDEEVNTTSDAAADIGISYEERTHESFARLCFWERMVWMIGHCPDVAYDKGISKMYDEDIMHEEEMLWLDYVTGGRRNNGMMRYAQFQMMVANKFRKNNPLFYAPKPKEDEKFDMLSMKVETSDKYGKFVILDFYFEGSHVKLMKGRSATNWLNPNKLDHAIMNEAIDWARLELTKK